jgi:hypothetical protein
MAISAGTEFDSSKLHGLVGAGGNVAFLAGYLGVHSGQRIFGFCVVELLRLLPVGEIVAALAVVTELPFVDVRMASHAVLR